MADPSERIPFLRRMMASVIRGRYTLLKFTHGSLDEIPVASDLDILVERQDVPRILASIETDPAVSRMRTLPRSFMVKVRVFLKDGAYVEVDLLHAFTRKSLVYLDACEVLARARPGRGEGWAVPSLEDGFAYVFLFSVLNGSDVPAKYREYYAGHAAAERNCVLAHVNDAFGLRARSLEELFTCTPTLRSRIVAALRRGSLNSGQERTVRYVRYLRDVTMRERGLVLTFSGVDGAGKSTVLEATRRELQTKYRQDVRVLRHRPGLLPILSAFIFGKRQAEQRTTTRPPRTGTNNSVVSSALRFAYYFADYLIGQFVVYLRHTMRGRVVLYDRYYFDFVVDPKRTNLRLSPRVARFLYRLLLEPDLNFFLFASPGVIAARKQELPGEVVEELTRSYSALFAELSGGSSETTKYYSIENVDLGETVAVIERTIARRL